MNETQQLKEELHEREELKRYQRQTIQFFMRINREGRRITPGCLIRLNPKIVTKPK